MDLEAIQEESIDLREKLGEGAFGLVRLGVVRTTQERVAVKLESSSHTASLLEHEAHVLRALGKHSTIPQLFSFGRAADYSYMVMQLLGHSLHQKFSACGWRFSLSTVLACGEQMAMSLATVHNAGYVHRDIKPQNFLLGRGADDRTVYIVDFGLAKKFNGMHLGRDSGSFTGTLPFASINAHTGVSPAMRDDLESLAYVLLFFLKGRLPWHSPALPSLPEREVRQLKSTFDSLQFTVNHPPEFSHLLQYARSLRFDEAPDYAFVLSLFRSVAKSLELSLAVVPDWETGACTPKRRQSISDNNGKKRFESRRSFRIETIRTRESSFKRVKTMKKSDTQEKLFQGFVGNRSVIMKKLSICAHPNSNTAPVCLPPADRHCTVF